MRPYGDDFTPDQISESFKQESEAFVTLSRVDHPFTYAALNEFHAWRRAQDDLGTVLAIGCGNGKELLQISNRVTTFIGIEPARSWWCSKVGEARIDYRLPNQSGEIDLADNTVDHVTCFGVLHHIPNVSAVLAEMVRVLKPGGAIFLREPISSMGEWGTIRPGLTRNERGIPLPWLRHKVAQLNMKVEYESPCLFPVIPRLAKLLGVGEPYNSRAIVCLDTFLSRLFAFNIRYERQTIYSKFAPAMCR